MTDLTTYKSQSELDNQVKELLSKYLSNKSNSVSGNNFKNLLSELDTINNTFLHQAKEYNLKQELN